MSPGQTKAGARPLFENRLDHHRPSPAYKKRSGFDFWQFKAIEIIGNNKNTRNYIVSAAVFLGACKR
jgi:hypothetical protein